MTALRLSGFCTALSVLLAAAPVHAAAPTPPIEASVTACFTAPGALGHCAARIAAHIDAARSTVLVQAYSFTSAPIIKALIAAHARGVDVRVILDKSMETGRYSGATPLLNAGVPVWIDYVPAIAHNKIIVIDDALVIGGSFNFTAAADTRNAENVVFMASEPLAKLFSDYWRARQRVAREMVKEGVER